MRKSTIIETKLSEGVMGRSAMETVRTTAAPAAIGPYSQAKRLGQLVFLSGQIPLDPATGEIAGLDIESQTEQVLRNIEAILIASGSCFENVVKTTCILSNMADFEAFNAIYAGRFISKPARSTLAAKELPRSVLVEIDLIAFI